MKVNYHNNSKVVPFRVLSIGQAFLYEDSDGVDHVGIKVDSATEFIAKHNAVFLENGSLDFIEEDDLVKLCDATIEVK